MSNTYTEEQLTDFLSFYKGLESLKLILENIRLAVDELHKIVPGLEALKKDFIESSLIELPADSYMHDLIKQQTIELEKKYAVLYGAMARVMEIKSYEQSL